MKVVENTDLAKIVEAKILEDKRYRKAIGAFAVYAGLKSFRRYKEGLMMAVKLVNNLVQTQFTVIELIHGSMIFDKPTEEVTRLIDGIKLSVINHVTPPHKVLVKMLVSRFNKLFGGIHYTNTQLTFLKGNDPTSFANTHNAVLPTNIRTKLQVQQLDDPDFGFTVWTHQGTSHTNKHTGGYVTRFTKEIKEFVDREEITDKIVSDAWDLVIINMILTQ